MCHKVQVGGFRGDDLYSYNYLGDSVQFEISEDVSAEKLKELNEQTKANEEKERHDETISTLNEQTEAIKEQNETSKNIFQKIGDILSYINPFSENFFAYKLVELIVNGLKSLFIPQERIF